MEFYKQNIFYDMLDDLNAIYNTYITNDNIHNIAKKKTYMITRIYLELIFNFCNNENYKLILKQNIEDLEYYLLHNKKEPDINQINENVKKYCKESILNGNIFFN